MNIVVGEGGVPLATAAGQTAGNASAAAAKADLDLMTPGSDVQPINAGNDNGDLTGGTCRGFWCSADATLAVVLSSGQTRTIYVAAHVIYPVRVTRLKATGTTLNSGYFHPIY